MHPKSRLARGFPSRLCVQKYLEDLVATTASIQTSDCPKCYCSLVPASCRCTEEDVSPVTLTSTTTIKGWRALANQAYSYRTYCMGRDDSKHSQNLKMTHQLHSYECCCYSHQLGGRRSYALTCIHTGFHVHVLTNSSTRCGICDCVLVWR